MTSGGNNFKDFP